VTTQTTPPLTPTALRCGYLVNPLGVAPGRVRFTWLLEGTGHDRGQRAYQILVASAEAADTAGPVWNSGRVGSAQSADIEYAGPKLDAGRRYTWKVRVWDERQTASFWSEPAWFEVELDQDRDWHASWIGIGRVRPAFRPPTGPGPVDQVARALLPVPYLRREFHVAGPVARARLYVTARGLYEARLNGSRIGDAVLAPGWTDYGQRIQYQTYDVTGLLHPGRNALGALLADGWYCGFIGFDAKRPAAVYGVAPELLAQLVIRLADGTEQTVVTDGEWRAAFGAIRRADLLMGERHDQALEHDGWDAAGFDDDAWSPVRCRERDAARLVADPGPPIRVTEEIAAKGISTDRDGRLIADFGQNLVGWVRARVGASAPAEARASAPPGARARIQIRHGEALAADGSLYTENLRTARPVDEYLTTGGAAGGAQVLEPRFTLHGFRYAEITGYPGEPGPGDLTARVVHSDIAGAGAFKSSEKWLNQLAENIDWGLRGNFISVPTDCPQRDERIGWLGDAQVFARTACYNRDVAAFFNKWLDDVADAQLPNGAFSDIAPTLSLDWAGAPGWGDAGVIVPWTLYRMYGDRSSLRRHFASMTAWMEFLERGNPDYVRRRDLGNSYNDWLAPGDDETPPELVGTAYWAYDAALMAEIADAIGRTGQAAGYRALASKIRSAFADSFVKPDGRVASGTQTAYALALHMQLLPEDLREAAARHLVQAVAAADWHLTTGFVGVGYLLPALCAHGHTDVAFRLLEQDGLPSWRYMVDHGATTIWERWDGWTTEHGFQSPLMNSLNHYALGSVGEWLYRFVLGIELAPGAAGFDRLVIRPHPGGRLSHAAGCYRSVRGPIESGWERSGGRFTLNVSLPPNVTASVRVPSRAAGEVRDGAGRPPAAIAGFPGAPGVGEAVFEVGSGRHEFSGPAPGD
jgi:alpha-L-rhamnosidase